MKRFGKIAVSPRLPKTMASCLEELFGSDDDEDDVKVPRARRSPGAVSTTSSQRLTNDVLRRCDLFLKAKPEGDDEDEDEDDEEEDEEEDDDEEEEEEEDDDEDDDDEEVENHDEEVDDDEDTGKVKVEEGDGADSSIEDKGLASVDQDGREEEAEDDANDESGGKNDKVKVPKVKGDGADSGSIEDKGLASSDQGGREEEAEDDANDESGGEEKEEVGEEHEKEGTIMLDAVRSTHSLTPDFVWLNPPSACSCCASTDSAASTDLSSRVDSPLCLGATGAPHYHT